MRRPSGGILDGMTETSSSAPPATGTCVFCGATTIFAAHSTDTHRYGEPDAEGKIPLIPRPAIWMCADDIRRYQRREIRPGWCDGCLDDPSHLGWGEAGTMSPCGEYFELLR